MIEHPWEIVKKLLLLCLAATYLVFIFWWLSYTAQAGPAPAPPPGAVAPKVECIRYSKIILNIVTDKDGKEVSRFYLFVVHWYILEEDKHYYLIPAWRSIQGDEKFTEKPRYDGLHKLEWTWGDRKYCVEAPFFEVIVTPYDYEMSQRPLIEWFRKKYPKHRLPTLEPTPTPVPFV